MVAAMEASFPRGDLLSSFVEQEIRWDGAPNDPLARSPALFPFFGVIGGALGARGNL